MIRRLLNFETVEVVSDINGQEYNLTTERMENIPQPKKHNYRHDLGIDMMGGENIDFAFNRYNKDIRMSRHKDVEVFNQANREIIKNQYVDGFKNYQEDLKEWKRYNIVYNYKPVANEDLTDLELKRYENKAIITGWGGLEEMNVEKISKEQVNKEKEKTIAETANADNTGPNQGGFQQVQAKELAENKSKSKEVELHENTPRVHGLDEDLYYKNFGLADKDSKLELKPQGSKVETENKDEVKLVKKKRLDFSSTMLKKRK